MSDWCTRHILIGGPCHYMVWENTCGIPQLVLLCQKWSQLHVHASHHVKATSAAGADPGGVGCRANSTPPPPPPPPQLNRTLHIAAIALLLRITITYMQQGSVIISPPTPF